MQRRNFIIGAGALATGTAAAVGSGAFSSVEASRDVSVEVADDAQAYLAIEATSDYAETDGDGVLELDFGDLGDAGEGEHVGEDSAYIFGSGNPDRNVFTVENRGTQDVDVTPAQQLIAFDDSGTEIQNENNTLDVNEDYELFIFISNFAEEQSTELTPGDSLGYFVTIGTGDDPPESVEANFEINANEV